MQRGARGALPGAGPARPEARRCAGGSPREGSRRAPAGCWGFGCARGSLGGRPLSPLAPRGAVRDPGGFSVIILRASRKTSDFLTRESHLGHLHSIKPIPFPGRPGIARDPGLFCFCSATSFFTRLRGHEHRVHPHAGCLEPGSGHGAGAGLVMPARAPAVQGLGTSRSSTVLRPSRRAFSIAASQLTRRISESGPSARSEVLKPERART